MRNTGSWKLVVTLALWALALSACERYSADPIEAWVVDASSGAPLEGVIVTANWQRTGGFEGSYPKGQMMVMETTTDKKGRFQFSGWGPKWYFGEGKLRGDQPQLILFKSGYQYRRLHNEVRRAGTYSGGSEWSGKTIEMKVFTGSSADWFSSLQHVVPPYDRPEEAKKSLMLNAILAEENAIPESIPEKRPFFDNIVRRLLRGDRE
jgi:hypothetical protein